MARANIFIRKENEEVWQSLGNKSDFVNMWLHGLKNPARVAELPVIKTKADAEKVIKSLMKDTSWGGPLFRDKKKSKL